MKTPEVALKGLKYYFWILASFSNLNLEWHQTIEQVSGVGTLKLFTKASPFFLPFFNKSVMNPLEGLAQLHFYLKNSIRNIYAKHVQFQPHSTSSRQLTLQKVLQLVYINFRQQRAYSFNLRRE